MAAYKPWVWCREPGCDTKLIFATRNGRRLPYEAQDRPPFETESIGCHVIVDGQAFTVAEALEHFQVRCETTTQKAEAALACVQALADEWDATPPRGKYHPNVTRELRAALGQEADS